MKDLYEDITPELAMHVGEQIGVDWSKVEYTPTDLAKGMLVETEHGSSDPMTNVTNDDALLTAKIALAHLNESPMYYVLLEEMERKF
jgi:hypothetical protein